MERPSVQLSNFFWIQISLLIFEFLIKEIVLGVYYVRGLCTYTALKILVALEYFLLEIGQSQKQFNTFCAAIFFYRTLAFIGDLIWRLFFVDCFSCDWNLLIPWASSSYTALRIFSTYNHKYYWSFTAGFQQLLGWVIGMLMRKKHRFPCVV